MKALKRMLARLAAWPLALLILFEEWGWEPLQRGMMRLAHALGLQFLEPRIRALPPYAALVLSLAPSLLLLPVKFGALWLVARGHYLMGTALIVAAKIAGTALLARVFTLTKDTLLTLPWFATLYTRWSAWKEALLAQVRASWAWRWGRVTRRRWRRQWNVWRHG